MIVRHAISAYPWKWRRRFAFSSLFFVFVFIFLGFYLKIEAHGRASKHVRFVDQKTNRKANTI